jgi:D-glycero-D-manno-heptose 1,7-bisphosphate phosphatase
MKKLLLVDLDGTIREPISSSKFILHPQDQRPIDGADRALANFAQQGYKIAGITNQAGVDAGHKTLADCLKEQMHTLELLPQIERIYLCPDFKGASLWEVDRFKKAHLSEFSQYFDLKGTFRKPKPGMLLAAIRLYEPELTLYVGDREEDEQAAVAAEMDFRWAWDWRAEFGGAG